MLWLRAAALETFLVVVLCLLDLKVLLNRRFLVVTEAFLEAGVLGVPLSLDLVNLPKPEL
jgi:hypothetical protein